MSIDKLETVLNALIRFAKVELEGLGVFPPVAGSLDGQGEIDLHMPRSGEDGTTQEFIDLLRVALRYGARRGEYEATGLCMECRAERPEDEKAMDAICVHLEAPGESLMAFVPYEKNGDGRVKYGEIFFGPADPHAFEDGSLEEGGLEEGGLEEGGLEEGGDQAASA